MQPLKKLHGHQFEIAPFSVLIDAKQVRVLAQLRQAAEQSSAGFPDNVLYIYEKQLEEADLIVLNKVDLLSADELVLVKASLARRFPYTPLVAMSALAGDGLDAWLETISQNRPAGQHITKVDYDVYAAGEAALGWLNASAGLRTENDIEWSHFANDFQEALREELQVQAAEAAHVKLTLTGRNNSLAANLTGNNSPVSVRGEIAPGERQVALLINARVCMEPNSLRTVVEAALQSTAKKHLVETTITDMRSFCPSRPQPTFRYESVV